jgi:hypothetical protein
MLKRDRISVFASLWTIFRVDFACAKLRPARIAFITTDTNVLPSRMTNQGTIT